MSFPRNALRCGWMLGTWCLVLAVLWTWLAATTLAQTPHVLTTDPLPAEEQLKKFKLPPGFEIQLVAAEPQVRKPINLNFDAAGRLYATQSVEYPYAAAEGAPRRDVVSGYWDLGPNGRARQVQVVVDGLNIPIGIAPLSRDLLVFSIPHLLHCRDTDGDGVFETREKLYEGFGFADTHGMVNNLLPWIDGWVYCCHGFRNDSQTQGADGQAVQMSSGNTFRIRADGSHAEPFTRGQVNPFGLTFDELGNVFSADCHTLPAYQLLRGAWYPSFGKPHDGLGYGPEMMRHLHGSTGIAGIAHYTADHFPAEYRDQLYIGNPITARVNCDRLARFGSTFAAIESPDFLSCDDPWFRPVDIELGPDGALYIADFYNRIIGHYEVPLDHPGRDRERGRIWRVVWRGLDGKAPPPAGPGNLQTMDAPRLVHLLGHPNLTVRAQAVGQLVERVGADAAPLVQAAIEHSGSTAAQRAFGLWVLERLKMLNDDLCLRLILDPAPVVRVQLVKALAERGDWSTSTGRFDVASTVRRALADEDAFVRRAAADALGRHPDGANLAPLLQLWQATLDSDAARAQKPPTIFGLQPDQAAPSTADTHLLHVVRMALRDQLLSPQGLEAAQALAASDPVARQRLAEVALGARTLAAAAFVLRYLQGEVSDRGRLPEYAHYVARYLAEDQLSTVLDRLADWQKLPENEQVAVLRGLQRAWQERGAAAPDGLRSWSQTLAANLLEREGEGELRQGIELARDARLADLFAAVAAVARGAQRPGGARQLALDACVAIDGAQSVAVLAAVAANAAEPIDLRQKSVTTLAAVNSDASRQSLVELLAVAPERVELSIAQGLAATPAGGEALLSAVTRGKASARSLTDRVVQERLRSHQREEFLTQVERLTAGLPTLDEKVRQLMTERRERFAAVKFDPAAGQAAFKKTCAACHRLAGQGNKVGPELDGIGLRGLDRLLEDLLDPSRNVDQAFRATQVLTKSGQVIQGLKLRQEGEVLILADAKGQEVRVPLDQIEEQEVTPLSPMPANVQDVVPEGDFYQLLGFLLEQRVKPQVNP